MEFSFCPNCGSKDIKTIINAHLKCENCGITIYQNSKPCVGVLVIKEQKVLLTQRVVEPLKGFWDIPGGFLELGEHPYDGAIREIQEETGLVIEPIEIFGIFMDEYGKEKVSTLNICYTAKVISGQLNAASDVTDVKWYSMEELPDDIAFEWSKAALSLLQKKLSS